jgi:hypothetical protein
VYNILIEFVVPMKLVRLIKIWLNEMHIKVYVKVHICLKIFLCKHPKQGDA